MSELLGGRCKEEGLLLFYQCSRCVRSWKHALFLHRCSLVREEVKHILFTKSQLGDEQFTLVSATTGMYNGSNHHGHDACVRVGSARIRRRMSKKKKGCLYCFYLLPWRSLSAISHETTTKKKDSNSQHDFPHHALTDTHI
jgi:chloramphenicol O-acetyltransferase